MSEPLDIVEVLRRPLETISQCRRMRYVTAEVAEIAAAEIARLRAAMKVIDECFAEMRTRLEKHCRPLPVIVKEERK